MSVSTAVIERWKRQYADCLVWSNAGFRPRFSPLLLCGLFFAAILVGCTSGSRINALASDGRARPLLIVVTGQSNAVQIFPSEPPVENPNPLVWDWATNGSGDVNKHATGPWFWQVPNPALPMKEDIYSGLVTGYSLGGRGGIAWGLANSLANATGRRVYMICTAMNGQAITQWEPNTGLVALELDLQVGKALTELQRRYPDIEYADIAVWAQGESDAYRGTTPSEYADRWFEWRNHVESEGVQWAKPDHTRWYIVELAANNPVISQWRGHEAVVARDPDNITLIPFGTKKTLDVVHYAGESATLYGKEIANHYLGELRKGLR